MREAPPVRVRKSKATPCCKKMQQRTNRFSEGGRCAGKNRATHLLRVAASQLRRVELSQGELGAGTMDRDVASVDCPARRLWIAKFHKWA